jgi:hypothetical protein
MAESGGTYFGESGEHSLYDVGKAIGDVLVSHGIGDNPEPTSFTQAELEKYFRVHRRGFVARLIKA